MRLGGEPMLLRAMRARRGARRRRRYRRRMAIRRARSRPSRARHSAWRESAFALQAEQRGTGHAARCGMTRYSARLRRRHPHHLWRLADAVARDPREFRAAHRAAASQRYRSSRSTLRRCRRLWPSDPRFLRMRSPRSSRRAMRRRHNAPSAKSTPASTSSMRPFCARRSTSSRPTTRRASTT